MDLCNFLLFAISSCIFIHVLFNFAWKWCSSKNNLPPGPKGLPLVGNLFMLGKRPHESLANLAKTHGPLMTLHLGCLTTVVVSSAEMAREVLQKNDQTFAGRTVIDTAFALAYHKGSMVFGQLGLHWRMLRRICNTQMFNVAKLDALQGLRQRQIEKMIEQLHESCAAARAIDLGQCAFTTVLNLIWNTMFSVDLVDHKLGSSEELKDLMWELMEVGGTPNLADYFPLLKLIDPQGLRRRAVKYFTKFYALFDEKINQRLRSRSSPSQSLRPNDLLDVLLDHSEDNGSDFRLEHIKPLLLDIFIAGSETNSTLVEWAMAELLRNRHVLAKAQSEIAETIGGERAVDESDIARLPYLQAVIKETFRLHPPAPLLIPHRAEATVEVAGFTVPKYTQVLINVWTIGRDGHVWEDPHSFSPERFLDSPVDFRGHDFQLIPFGAGRRICPGLPLAVRVVHLILASFLQSFDWKLPEGVTPERLDMREKFGITLQKATPLHAIPCKFGSTT